MLGLNVNRIVDHYVGIGLKNGKCINFALFLFSLVRKILAKKLENGQEPLKKGETPLSRQFNQIKAKYPGAILLFRVGDFYETFGEDAVKASKILGIVLTRRNNGNADDQLAGFPHHSLDTYLPKLVRAGQRVAICDQLEDPKMTKSIVKRGVTELVTPGVSMNDEVLQSKSNNFLAASICSGVTYIIFLFILFFDVLNQQQVHQCWPL